MKQSLFTHTYTSPNIINISSYPFLESLLNSLAENMAMQQLKSEGHDILSGQHTHSTTENRAREIRTRLLSEASRFLSEMCDENIIIR
jgi:hypothetical protein